MAIFISATHFSQKWKSSFQVLVCMGVLFGTLRAEGATRVALLSRGTVPADAISQVYPKFTDDPRVELVDRDALHKSLDEHALAYGNSIDTAHAVELGKAANADVLAIVECANPSDGDSPELGFIAFDSATSVRLVDVTLNDEDKPDVLAEQIAGNIRLAVEKRTKGMHDGRALCLLTARNVDLPESSRGFCDGVAALFQRQLLNSPAIVLLERERLGVANQDHTVVGDKTNREGMTLSPVTIELNLARAGELTGDKVIVTATIHDISGQLLGKVRANGEMDDTEGLASALASEVLKALSLAPPAQLRGSVADTQLEASRFERESTVRAAHADWREAADAADVACAIRPSDQRDRIQLARTLIMYGISTFIPHVTQDTLIVLPQGFKQSASELDTNLRLLHRATGELLVAGRIPRARKELAPCVESLHHFIAAMLEDKDQSIARADRNGIFSPPQIDFTGEQKDLLTLIIRDYRKYEDEIDEPMARAAVHDGDSFTAYSATLLTLLGDECHLFAGTSNEYTTQVAMRFPAWAELAAKYATKNVTIYGPVEELTETAAWGWCGVNHDWMNTWRPGCFDKLDAVDARHWTSAVDSLEKARAPARLYINLRPWIARITNPPPHHAEAPPDDVAPPTPQQVKPAVALSPLFSKEVSLIDVNAAGSDLLLINEPMVVGNEMYVAALARADKAGNGEVRLLKLVVDGDPQVQVLSHVALDADTFDRLKSDSNAFCRSSHFLGSEHYTVSTYDGQVIVLPLSNAPGRVIVPAKELPGAYVQSVADLGNILFLALSGTDMGAYLVSYDLTSGHTQTLVSSRREDKKSPFDDLAPMALPVMVADAPRDRIVFFAYHSQWDDSIKGLWEFNKGNQKFRKLLGTKYDRKENQGGYEISASQVCENKFILMTSQQPIIYDLAADAPTRQLPPGLSQFQHDLSEPNIFKKWWYQFGNPGGSGVGFGDNTIEQRLGDVHALSELKQGAFPPFAKDWQGGRLLVADGNGVWLLTPQSPSTQPAQSANPATQSRLTAVIEQLSGADPIVNLRWDFPKENAVSGYEIESERVGPDEHGQVENYHFIDMASGGNNTNYQVTGLSPGRTYNFRIRADYVDGGVSDYFSTSLTLPGKN